MATHQAILATAQTIQHLLSEAAAPTEFSGAAVRLAQAGDPADGLPPAPDGIRLYLYQVAAHSAQRSNLARNAPVGGHTRPPLPLELHFLLAPWSASAATQLALLGWAMRVLDDTPLLTAAQLNASFPAQAVFRVDENVALIFNPLPLAELARLWENLRPASALPSATYVARPVVIDS
jgi:hypothetical protein